MVGSKLFDIIYKDIETLPFEGVLLDDMAIAVTEFAKKDVQNFSGEKGLVSVGEINLLLQTGQKKLKGTIVSIVNRNMPFLLASLRGLVRQLNLSLLVTLHPVFYSYRKPSGEAVDLSFTPLIDGKEKEFEESLIVFVFDHALSENEKKKLIKEVQHTVTLIKRVVSSWGVMRGRISKLEDYVQNLTLLASAEDKREILSFLHWVDNDHFTFLGYRSCLFNQKEGPVYEENLGVFHEMDKQFSIGHIGTLDGSNKRKNNLRLDDVLTVTKTNVLSPIHRLVPMDMINLKQYDENGRVVGEHQFVGLFTSTAYSRAAQEIPLIRLKIDRVLAKAGFLPSWHDGKALMHIIETLPRDELFQYSDEELYKVSIGVLRLQTMEKPAVFVRKNPLGRSVTALVYIPMEQYTPDLRRKIQKLLETTFGGSVCDWTCKMGSLPFSRLYFTLSTLQDSVGEYDHAELERRIESMSMGWLDRFKAILISRLGQEKAEKKFKDYGHVFPLTYQDTYSPQEAVDDINVLEAFFSTDKQFSVDLNGDIEGHGCSARIRLFSRGNAVTLADIFPMMANMGLRVMGESSFKLCMKKYPLWIHDFSVNVLQCQSNKVLEYDKFFEECLRRVWLGQVEDDRFNALILRASMSWRDIVILRALSRYLRQIQPLFNPEYVQRALFNHAGIAQKLVGLFHLRFNPAEQKNKTKEERFRLTRKHAKSIESDLGGVSSLEEDRILRSLFNLIMSTVRTNYYQKSSDGGVKSYVSFKFDCSHIQDMPLPKPKYEIFVYSPEVEAVHLRGGKVARGGIRWSDRQEDFRTEILGLVKAQMVKNAVIVPEGAKGGFIVKNFDPGASKEEQQKKAIQCYKILIKALLDVTDNYVQGKIIHPSDTVLYDDDDPYLVVAADKGTATFSDIANAISMDRKFWLGDAFASGGSDGYDHKKMGITAKGAWVSVSRHFRELGLDVSKENFSVVGVGDMSGDVFGNGMLCSQHIKLVGAFNHLHIFLDPNPDTQQSFKERKRLFDMPRSTWMDYDTSLISKGGGVFDRKAKSIRIGPEIQKLYGLESEEITPDELIKTMLKAPVDLIWFGGIGTYVKSSVETHQDVGDKVNNGVRVNGKEVRARVIGEGANLGLTQLGRVEYAAQKGHINTDAIDNSGGVDCSDHEVNLKILLQQVIETKKLSIKERNNLLMKMEKDVAALVLKDNYQQTQCISLIHFQGSKILDQQERFIKNQEREGYLNRDLEKLPSDEVLAERLGSKVGLYRPEIAVLMAYAKLDLKRYLLMLDELEHPAYKQKLLDYFPKSIQEKYADKIFEHPLRKELISTILTNEVVNRCGLAFMNDMGERTSSSYGEIVEAFYSVSAVFDLPSLWEEIESLDYKVSSSIQTEMNLRILTFMRRAVLWFLRHADQPLDLDKNVKTFKPAINTLGRLLPTLITKNDLQKRHERARDFINGGVPEGLAMKVVYLSLLAFGCRVVKVAERTNVPLDFAAATFYQLADALGLGWLLEVGSGLSTNSYWEKVSIGSILDDITAAQGDLTEVFITDMKKHKKWQKEKPETLVNAWLEEKEDIFARFKMLLSDFKSSPSVDLSMIGVASRQLSRVLSKL